MKWYTITRIRGIIKLCLNLRDYGIICDIERDYSTKMLRKEERVMYQCPDCGGNLKFDIPSQMLSCVYCDALVNPYDVVKETDAVQNEFFEAKIFTCPQCGGEVYSIDNEAASFCSYCGASAILSERISNEKCPNHIITFKVTKEDCKKQYKKVMSKAFFAPSKLKNADFIDGFRGIYMPYWNYSVKQEGQVNLPATKSHRSGDYIVTEHFDVKGYLSSTFAGDVHDASANFYDEISEALAPYDTSDCIDFTPSFLSGFYADAADVDKSMYVADAIRFAEDTNLERIKREHLAGYTLDEKSKSTIKQWPLGDIDNIKSAMFPVWFLSYRNKDRVAYATVNGQTGKVVADMPISVGKYILTSLLMALPIFFLLNIAMVFRASVLLTICSVLLLITSIICNGEIKEIYEKEYNIGDLGLEWRKHRRRVSIVKKKDKDKKINSNIIKYVIIVFSLFPLISAFLNGMPFLISILIMIIMVVVIAKAIEKQRKIEKMGIPIGLIFSLLASVISIFISIINPVSDIWYYSGVIIILFAIILNFIFIIKNYNRIAMRRLPQFDRRGGDDGAY